MADLGDFEINGETVSDLFQQQKFVFTIPEFQRNVAWDAEFTQLLNDIKEEKELNDKAFYYIGSIISFINPKKKWERQVIDGQQRLTSLVILFRAYRDYLETLIPKNDTKANEKIIELIEEERTMAWTILFKDKVSTERKKNILSTTHEGGQEFLNNFIFNKSRKEEVSDKYENTEKHLSIYNQAFKFLEKLASETTVIKKKIEIVESFISYTLHNVKVADVVAEDFKQAFTMFERMNDRGRGLSTTDKFKYLLMSQYSDLPIERFQDKASDLLDTWEEIELIVSKSSWGDQMKSFLFHHLQAWYWTSKVGESRVIKEARSIFETYNIDPQQFINFMKEDAKNWVNITQGRNVDGDEDLNLKFKGTFISKFTQYAPVLLVAMSEGPKYVITEDNFIDKDTLEVIDSDVYKYIQSKSKFSKASYKQITSDIVYLAFVDQVTGAGFNDFESALPEMIKHLRLHNFKEYKSKVNFMFESQKDGFESRLLNTKILTDGNGGRGIRHFVFHIMEKEVQETIREDLYEHTPKIYNNDKSEEHIIPKVVEKVGTEDETDRALEKMKECKPKDITNEEYKKYIWRLGNLVAFYSKSNSATSDKSPKEKWEENIYGGSSEYTAQLLVNNGVTGNGEKQDGSDARKFLKDICFQPIELVDGKFTPEHIILREHIIFKLFSLKMGVDLEHREFDPSMCVYCK